MGRVCGVLSFRGDCFSLMHLFGILVMVLSPCIGKILMLILFIGRFIVEDGQTSLIISTVFIRTGREPRQESNRQRPARGKSDEPKNRSPCGRFPCLDKGKS